MVIIMNNTDELMEAIKEKFMQDLLECFEEVFVDLARESMKSAIKSEVYAKYRPQGYRQYHRRKEQGGLIDDRNIIVEVYRTKDGNIIGHVKNITTGAGKAYELVDVIESGIGYDWETSKIFKMQPYPRPFHENTIERIEKSRWQYHVRRLMNQRGWKTRGK